MAQLPWQYRKKILFRTDGAGFSHGLHVPAPSEFHPVPNRALGLEGDLLGEPRWS